MAERVGFEPTVLSHTAFRERHHQPLGHLSVKEDTADCLSASRSVVERALATPSRNSAASACMIPDTTRTRRRSASPDRAVRGCRRRRWRGRAVAKTSPSTSLLEQRADAHGARLVCGEDDHPRQLRPTQPASCLAQHDHYGVGSWIAGRFDLSRPRATSASSRTATAPSPLRRPSWRRAPRPARRSCTARSSPADPSSDPARARVDSRSHGSRLFRVRNAICDDAQ